VVARTLDEVETPSSETGVPPSPANREPRLPRVDPHVDNRKRFIRAVSIAWAIAAVPFLYVLMDEFTGTLHPLRLLGPNDFYDLQARAMLHGHLWVKTHSLSIEGFVHGGHTYTYFGVFPSLLRIPVLLVAPGLEGKLTTPSMLLAWIVACSFTVLLLWRVRVMIRGSALLGRVEAATYGILVATVAGGSILLFLAAAPWVYNEDLAWSVALVLGTLFALLGVLERPSTRRVLLAGVLLAAVSLDRLPTGWACVLGAFMVAGWFALGQSGRDNRRWAIPVLGCGVLGLALSCTVNLLKFGVPFGLPFADQVWTHLNAHRRQYLATSGGKGYGLQFLPTTAMAYLQPFGLRLEPVFPFITLPATPPALVGHPVFDRIYRTASIPASSPLLVLLSIWGIGASIRRRSSIANRKLWPILIAAGIAPGTALLWGYIAPRYEADFMPLLVVGAIVGLVHLWNRWDRRTKKVQGVALAAVSVVALFSVLANIGIAISPTGQWRTDQTVNFVHEMESLNGITGNHMASYIKRGNSLPYYAPADELFVVGQCQGVYISNGEEFQTIPEQQVEHTTWVPVEQGADVFNTLAVTLTGPIPDLGSGITLMSIGKDNIVVIPSGNNEIRVGVEGPRLTYIGQPFPVKLHKTYHFTIETDPILDHAIVAISEVHPGIVLNSELVDGGGGGSPAVVHEQGETANSSAGPIAVRNLTPAAHAMPVCHSLLRLLGK